MGMLEIDEILSQYPNQWVLIGEPVWKRPELQTTARKNLQKGYIITHAPTKAELTTKGKELTAPYQTFTWLFTGEIPKGVPYLL